MARKVTLLQLRTRVRQRADVENNTHVTDAEINGLINDGITQFWDQLVTEAPPDYFRKSVNLTIVPGQLAYNIPTIFPDGDFYKLRRVYVSEANRLRPLNPVQEDAVLPLIPAQQACTVRIHYIPSAPLLVSDSDEFDGVNGWDELIVLCAAIDVKNKREEDASSLLRKQAKVEERIARMAYRDAGVAERVVERKMYTPKNDPYFGMSSWLMGYRLAADTIEFYQGADY